MTVSPILCNSDSPVSIALDRWKSRCSFVKIKSMHDGFSWFLKQFASLARLQNVYVSQNAFIEESPEKIMFSYFDEWASIDLDKQFVHDSKLLLLVL